MRVSTAFTCALAVAAALWGRPVLAQAPPVRTLKLAFNPDRTVSLSAQNVSVREILAEWARQCGCFVVNWDKLVGGTLQTPVVFERASQALVLESLLRQAAGYVLTPRREDKPTISNYETIYILATSTAVAGSYVPPVVPSQPLLPMPTVGSPEDEIPSIVPQPMSRPQTPGQSAQPPMPQAPTGPTVPGMAPGTQVPRQTGSSSVFVPIIPVISSQTTPPSGQTPGAVAAPTPAPNLPTPPQGR